MSVLTMIAQGFDPAINRSRAEGETARLKNEGQAITNLAKTAELDEFMATTGTRRQRENAVNRLQGAVARESTQYADDFAEAKGTEAQMQVVENKVDVQRGKAMNALTHSMYIDVQDDQGVQQLYESISGDLGEEEAQKLFKSTGLDQGYSEDAITNFTKKLINTTWHDEEMFQWEHKQRWEHMLSAKGKGFVDLLDFKSEYGQEARDVIMADMAFSTRFGSTDRRDWSQQARSVISNLERQAASTANKQRMEGFATDAEFEKALKSRLNEKLGDIGDMKVSNLGQVREFARSMFDSAADAGNTIDTPEMMTAIGIHFEPVVDGKMVTYKRRSGPEAAAKAFDFYAGVLPDEYVQTALDAITQYKRGMGQAGLALQNKEAVRAARETAARYTGERVDRNVTLPGEPQVFRR